MSCIEFSTIFVILLSVSLAQKSPCPKYFSFEPSKAKEDRWYGIITLVSPRDISEATLELQFDKSVIQLGNWFGLVEANSDNTVFKIKNKKKSIKANTPTNVQIYVVYHPYYDIPFPQIKRILLNGREICPNEDLTTYETPAITINIIRDCGRKDILPTALITSGQNTTAGHWPWHAALYTLEGRKREYRCGGTLISEKHILTAAHCTTVVDEDGNLMSRDPNSVQIILGHQNHLALHCGSNEMQGKYGIYVYGKYEQNRNVTRIFVHPNYNQSNFHNDISIIILNNPVQFTEYVKPICLWEEGTDESTVVNRLGTAVGWGRDENGNEITDLLMEAKMPVVERLKCILKEGSYYSKFTTENTLCAGFANGTSVCNGDSGGGLVFPKKGTSGRTAVWQIRGIVSNTISKVGNVCDPNYYVIFTDVAKYLKWINETISTS